MAKLIGTAGHVDHGKTALIRALTGIDADRLPEEKKRGMTIDVGFAYIDFPTLGRVSIVDVPGHERFLRNMLVGALGVDVALLCVAADEGIKPQTREHFQILELLPVQQMTVALTRSDLADNETREIARLEVLDLLNPSRFKDAPVITVSAETGEGLDELKDILEGLLANAEQPRAGPWYLPIDRAFSAKGQGSVVTGTLAQGCVRVGDAAILLPGGLESRVRSIHTHNEAVESAEFGKRVALNLGGIKLEDLHRGQIAGDRGAVFETAILDASLLWIAPVKHGQRIRVSIGAEEAMGRLFLNDAAHDLAQLRLEQTIACAKGQPLIIRSYSPPDLLGGGKVLVPQARKRRKNEAALGGQNNPMADLPNQILTLLEQKPEGLPTEEVCRLTGRTPQELGDPLERLSKSGRAVGLGGMWLSQKSFEEAKSRFLTALGNLHLEQPAKLWQPREAALRSAELKWTGKPVDRFIAALAASGDVYVNGTQLKRTDFLVRLSDKQSAFLGRVIEELNKGGLNPPSTRDLARALTVPPQAVEEILRLGIEAGEIVRLPEDIYYTPGQIIKVKTTIQEMFGAQAFTAAEFRDRVQTSRKYAIPLLEYLDSVRFTLRVGDKRVVSQPEEAQPQI